MKKKTFNQLQIGDIIFFTTDYHDFRATKLFAFQIVRISKAKRFITIETRYEYEIGKTTSFRIILGKDVIDQSVTLSWRIVSTNLLDVVSLFKKPFSGGFGLGSIIIRPKLTYNEHLLLIKNPRFLLSCIARSKCKKKNA